MDFGTWLLKGDPTNFSFTILVYLLVMFACTLIWRKLVPFYIDKRWPAEQALKERRVTAEIEARKIELQETRLMREALERLSGLSERLSLMLELHDQRAGVGIENIMTLQRITLDKLGLDPSGLQAAVIKQQELLANQQRPPEATAPG